MRTPIPKPMPGTKTMCSGVGGASDPVSLYLLTLSPGSRRTMTQALDVVAGLVRPGATTADLNWGNLTYAVLTRVRAELASRYATTTCHKMLAATRGVLRQAMLVGEMTEANFTRCVSIRAVRGSTTFVGRRISGSDMTAMVTSCDTATALGVRDVAMAAVLYGCGLRRAEVVGLALADYDSTARTLHVVGKGRKHRTAFLNSEVVVSLERWIDLRGREPGSLFVHIGQNGVLTTQALSTQAVYRMTARLARQARVPRPSPHAFRRAFVSDLLERGADLSVVQRLAGHASPSTTSRYDVRGEEAQRRAVELLTLAA